MTDPRTAAAEIRRDVIRLAYAAGRKGAHIAPSLSEAELLAVLYGRIWRPEDHFVLSKGHGALGWYAALYQAGLLDRETLLRFEENGGPLPGQPSANPALGIEYSSGTLGMGLSYGTGLAWSLRRRGEPGRVFVLLGDGELNEGSVWESALLAGHQRLANLTALVDWNGMQSDGVTDTILHMDLEALWRASGWDALVCDGHDTQALEAAFLRAAAGERPAVILARTVKGRGVSFMENAREWHHNHLTPEQYAAAMEELGGAPDGV